MKWVRVISELLFIYCYCYADIAYTTCLWVGHTHSFEYSGKYEMHFETIDVFDSVWQLFSHVKMSILPPSWRVIKTLLFLYENKFPDISLASPINSHLNTRGLVFISNGVPMPWMMTTIAMTQVRIKHNASNCTRIFVIMIYSVAKNVSQTPWIWHFPSFH